MQDTTTPRQFVLFSCDTWSIAAEFASETPLALAASLSAYNEDMYLPERVSWRRVARRLFRGVPVFFTSGTSGFVLLPSALAFYKLEGQRLIMNESQYWTFEQSNAAAAEFEAKYPNGVSVRAVELPR